MQTTDEHLHNGHVRLPADVAADQCHNRRASASIRRQVDQFWCSRLHAEREFVAGNATGNLRIVHRLIAFLIEFLEGIQTLPLHDIRHARRIGQIQYRLTLRTKQHAGIMRW